MTGDYRYRSNYRKNGRGDSHNGGTAVRKKIGTNEDLRNELGIIDHRGYPAYKSLTGKYRFERFILSIDHVQGDPFASPSSLSIFVPGSEAGFGQELYDTDAKRVALQDVILRRFCSELDKHSHMVRGSGKSGLLACSRPGQEKLDRSACQVDSSNGNVTVRFQAGFPAAGRTTLAGELAKMLLNHIPECAERSLFAEAFKESELKAAADLAEDQSFIRRYLRENDMIAFAADGAVLPRESGISQKPMSGCVKFRSPEEDRIEIDLPNHGKITGMAIKKGITLIVGGGYHGKSTLLKALERGVYDHIAGDGREYVICDEDAVKIRAEDGRCVHRDDISLFINDLPDGRDTSDFSTEDASGSTSQAASTVEAIESGASVLLLDEDTCATNFMVRDELMQSIVSPDEEPITPFIDRMRGLYEDLGISTVLVAGSSGAFFSRADNVIQMNRYVPHDITGIVREKTGPVSDEHHNISKPDFGVRKPRPGREFSGRNGRIKHKNLGVDGFSIGHGTVDLRAVEQIVDGEQNESISLMLIYAAENLFDGRTSIEETVSELMKRIQSDGIGGIVAGGRIPGNLAVPRRHELFAAINRCRFLNF